MDRKVLLPSGIKVPTKEAAKEYITKHFKISEEKIRKIGKYVPTDGEVEYIKIALSIPGKPIALAGPPGLGKTTLVYNLAYDMDVPLVRFSPGVQPYQVVGMPPDVETHEFFDTPLTALVRSGLRGLVLFDDAVKLDPRVFTLIANMMDRIQELHAKSNEVLMTEGINVLFTYNSPTELDRDVPFKDLPEFIRSRLAVVRFKIPTGAQAMDIIRRKYEAMDNSAKILKIIEKYKRELGELYDELNGTAFCNQYEGIMTARCTTRMVERVVETIAAGAKPLEAVRHEIASVMFDVDSETADSAIEAVIVDAKGKGIKD
ncbi:MAG: hypothetical protein QXT45_01515 [Candidatus Bilamarchaeaceae archaeon]